VATTEEQTTAEKSTHMNHELLPARIVQDDIKICAAQHVGIDRWSIQLFHRQLVKGIPTFHLDSNDSLMMFQMGFLYGKRAREKDYKFYCEAMIATYRDYIILELFNVEVRDNAGKFLPGVDKYPALR
jgi:hypothetical protein